MSPAWSVEWLVASRRRRLLALNAGIPLLLVTPVALAGAPSFHASAVFSVLFVIFGVFGSAIPLVRDGSRGILTRWQLAGLSAREVLTARLAAQATLDTLVTLPAAALIVLAGAGGAGSWGALLLALPFALLVANALGAWAAALARSLAEAALFAAVVSLLFLHLAGVFRVPAPGTLSARLEALGPFRVLHESLLQATGGGPAFTGSWWPALICGVGLVLITLAAAPFLVARLVRSEED